MNKAIIKSKSVIEKRYKLIVILFFLIFLLIGIFIYGDYGISWDEPLQRNIGIVSVNYIMDNDQLLLISTDRDHGPIFEVLLITIERIFNLSNNSRAIYFMRHLVTFLLFYASIFFFYKLCKHKFKNWKIGLLGSLFLILSPRIFAHSFYNSKDIPFLALFIISIYTLIRYLNNKTWYNAIFHAIACAFLIDIRILGIIVPLFTYYFFIADLLMVKDPKIKTPKAILSFIIYITLLISCIILFWPTLWTGPFHNFIEAYKSMRGYLWPGSVLYIGNFINSMNLPWHYIPVWIVISTPILYTAGFTIGCFITIKLLLKNPIQSYIKQRNDYIFILWFFMPLATVILLKSTLYDAWRHMFFIYPAFLILSLTGLISSFNFIKIKLKGPGFKIISTVFILIIASSLIYTAQFMIRYHPYQNVYFNPLAGRDMKVIKNNFELDYWGLSYREALEYILENDKGETIKIYVTEGVGFFNRNILKPGDKERLIYVENPEEANYFISNYRYHPDEYPYENEFYSIEIGGAKIMIVYKL